MGSDLIAGLQLSAIGMGLTFLALGLLILVMVLLRRLFPEHSAAGLAEPKEEATQSETLDDRRLEEMAVALAVGICLLERGDAFEYRDPSLGKLLEQ